MNRQSVSKVQKPKNSTLLTATDILQRKTINRTDFGGSTVDTGSPSGQQIDKPSLPGAGAHFNHDFSNIPVRLNSLYPIQGKLKIGQPGDKYEQEADRMAEQVMRMPDPRSSSSVGNSSQASSTSSHNGTIQRACVSCSAEYKMAEDENRPVKPANLCPKCRTREDGVLQTKEITPLIQAKTPADVTPEVTPAINSGIQSLQGGGQPLSGSERSFFEPRFGADFSNVRVHNDTRAANAVRSVNARAFTLRHNVVFGAGEYSPEATSGRKLLAHELTHVLQQDGGPTQIRRSPRPWPINGRVINDSDQAVRVWSDDRGFYEIQPHSNSDRFGEDVDYIQDRYGHWYKIGPYTVTVDENGEVTGFDCLALQPGGPCLPGDRFPPPNEASGSGTHLMA